LNNAALVSSRYRWDLRRRVDKSPVISGAFDHSMTRVPTRASVSLDKIVPEFCPSICHAVIVSMPERDGTRL
jgi:hypothetical protein